MVRGSVEAFCVRLEALLKVERLALPAGGGAEPQFGRPPAVDLVADGRTGGRTAKPRRNDEHDIERDDFAALTPDDIAAVAALINERPSARVKGGFCADRLAFAKRVLGNRLLSKVPAADKPAPCGL